MGAPHGHLGTDENEPMTQFAYRLRPTRIGMLAEGPSEREAETVGRHFAYLKALCDQGQVLMAGRTLTADEGTFGIVVFEAASADEARSLVDGDPAVREGVMRAEWWPFRVALWSAGGPRGGDTAASS